MATLAVATICVRLRARTKVYKTLFKTKRRNTVLCNYKKKHIGFYVQINSETDARQRVIEYALVMARPMVLYQADHPVHWSPVFLGGRLTQLGTDSENRRRLVTTVSTPVYDRRNHSQRVANLLGVVGTDVPIEDIKKMVPQYKVSRFDHNEF